MKSYVTLYYKSLLNAGKNFVLDNPDGTQAIETYLATLTKEVISDFQYVKQGLSIAIKLNKNQTNLEMVDSKDLNYVSIKNYNIVNNSPVYEKTYYYFVVSKTWKSTETIELVLTMDTLNTFRFNYDYQLNAKTLTKRIHKDRFEKILDNNYVLSEVELPSWTTTDSQGTFLFEDDWYDSGDAPSEEDAESFRQYGANVNIRYIYDETLDRNLELNEYDPLTAEIQVDMAANNDFLFKWKIRIDPTLYNHEFYVCFEVVGVKQKIIKKIDLKSEDISAPVYKKNETLLKEQRGNLDANWVLYYKNSSNQDNAPVDCYLTTEDGLIISAEGGSNTITLSDIPVNTYLFVCPEYNGQVLFKVNNFYVVVGKTSRALSNVVNIEITRNCIAFFNDNGTLKVYTYIFKQYVNPAVTGDISVAARDIMEFPSNPTIVIHSPLTELKVRQMNSIGNSYGPDALDNPFEPSRYTDTISMLPLVTRELAPSYTIDKTLSENLKIINIPYCPSQLSEQNGKYVIEGLWSYIPANQFFKLVDLSSKFKNTITSNADDILNVFLDNSPTFNSTLIRTYIDSKLYHSDYYRPKFVYDSFTKIFPLEQIDYLESYKVSSSNKFKFTFIMSRNIVSKFLFQFNYVYKASTEDYPNIVAVARNNEEVLYNSAYLNYVRTGYNYDLKSKERQESASGVGIGLNLAGFLASIALSFVPGGQALGITSAIGTGLGLVNQMVNMAKTTAQNEENIQKKLVETQRQGVSVLNADDYDLLYAYTSNKAKLCLYEVSDNMKKVLDDLFYYCGYIVNKQMIPNISSRYWFNFVQAGLIIEETSNLNSNIEDDIKEKFEQGVTFLHYHNKFDFKQEMENWEVSLQD